MLSQAQSRLRRALLVAASVAAVWAPALARAQDEDDGDRQVPTVVRSTNDDGRPRHERVEAELDLGLFGGAYAQAPRAGLLGDLELGLAVPVRVHTVSLSAGYLHDPFAFKNFNFEEDERADTTRRLVRSLDEVDGRIDWDAQWLDALRSRVSVDAEGRFAEFAQDDRWQIATEAGVHAGAEWNDVGPFAEATVGAFRRGWPRYRVADRSLDARGGGGGVQAGYSAGRLAEAWAEWEILMTDYLDARYDAEAPDGSVVRADESKSYVRNQLSIGADARPSRRSKVSLTYAFWRNDARDYTRLVSGLDASGAREDRLVRDYFDYARHGVSLSGRWRHPVGVRIDGEVGYWRRAFDTYQARDRDNRWLDETRVDHETTVELELAWQVHESRHAALDAVAFGSHVARRSNMTHDSSFATTFDISRVLVGIELHAD